ncbi:hypothetical protein EMCRGX_G002034 [Ephydatia muelleri]
MWQATVVLTLLVTSAIGAVLDERKRNTLPSEDCPPGMIYSDCGSSCSTSCHQPGHPPICLAVCEKGCFCSDDILALDWDRGRHAAFDVTVTSSLSVSILPEASMSVGAAAEAKVRKHRANDPKCSELGWVCVPLAVETYGNWGKEAQATFSRLASCIATTSSCHKSQVLGEMYGRLNFTLVRAISRAILGKCLPIKDNVEL